MSLKHSALERGQLYLLADLLSSRGRLRALSLARELVLASHVCWAFKFLRVVANASGVFKRMVV